MGLCRTLNADDLVYVIDTEKREVIGNVKLVKPKKGAIKRTCCSFSFLDKYKLVSSDHIDSYLLRQKELGTPIKENS